jgi:hypothetical protein
MSCAYIKRSRISNAKFREFLRLFCLDLTATQIAAISHLNRNTANRLITLIRKRMAHLSVEQARIAGVVEVDESYYGPHRVRGTWARSFGQNHCLWTP